MSEKRIERKIDELSGMGKMFGSSEFLADATYRVDVYQEFIEGVSSSGSYSIPGLKRISGVVCTHPEEELFMIAGRDELVLHMERGLRLGVILDSDGRITATGYFTDDEGEELI